MAVVFQYGSNMSVRQINSADRLKGDAKVVGIARTVNPHDLAFTVWSKKRNCATADIIPSDIGRSIYGVLYDIPNYLLSRDTANQRKSLDAIEGEGMNYVRKNIEVVTPDGRRRVVLTYVVKNPKHGLKTSLSYVEHILCGVKEHGHPEDYFRYVLSCVTENNNELRLPEWDGRSGWCSKPPSEG